MTKRFGNFLDNNNKKFKTNESLNDLWGDDLDAKDVDDCFALATQACKQDFTCTQRNNVSILPPYNIFKQTSISTFTSTQSVEDTYRNLPSTSNTAFTNGLNKQISIQKQPYTVEENSFKRTRSFESVEPSQLEWKFKHLNEQYVAKEGEVSILRTQLKDVRATKENDHNKNQKEWTDKLTVVTKQLNATRSELEFKNLEIANLKQKVIEVAKLNNVNTTLNSTQSSFSKMLVGCPEKYPISSYSNNSKSSNCKEDSNKKGVKIQPIIETKIPLQHRIPATLYTFPTEEKYLIDIKSNDRCTNTIPFLQNQMSRDVLQQLIRLQPKHTVLHNNKLLEFDYVYCEISSMMKSNIQEIESEQNNTYINKIICVSEQVIFNLYQFLSELEQNSQIDNSQKIDAMYLKQKFQDAHMERSLFDTNKWCDGEMGISAKQSIVCISEILPYNSYLRDYLLNNKPLSFKEDEEFLKYFPSIIQPKLEKNYSNNYNYLQLLTSIVVVIGKLKISNNFPGFLCAVTILLNKICLCSDIKEVCPIILKLLREIILSQPNNQTLLHTVEFLKNASLQNVFVNQLCRMPKIKNCKFNEKETILYYNQDTCILQVLCVLLENVILKVENFQILDLYLNLIQFVSNSMKANPNWLFYQEDKHYDCLCKIVKLFVDIMYKTTESCLNNEDAYTELPRYSKVLKSGLRTLHVLYFKVDELIVKYVRSYSQYKDIVKSLLSLKNILELTESESNLLDDLNITEEMSAIESTMFDRISLWN